MADARGPGVKRILWLVAVCLLEGAAATSAGELTQSLLETRSKQFVIVFGGASVNFDSSFKYLDKETGRSFFLDPEGQLGLPEKQQVPTLTMLATLKDRHFISVGATRFRR